MRSVYQRVRRFRQNASLFSKGLRHDWIFLNSFFVLKKSQNASLFSKGLRRSATVPNWPFVQCSQNASLFSKGLRLNLFWSITAWYKVLKSECFPVFKGIKTLPIHPLSLVVSEPCQNASLFSKGLRPTSSLQIVISIFSSECFPVFKGGKGGGSRRREQGCFLSFFVSKERKHP